MFSLAMTWTGAIVGLLVLAVMMISGILANSEGADHESIDRVRNAGAGT